MTYCPVLLQIQHDDLKTIFGGEYLLQVYNLEGTCVFDKVLKYDITSWNIFFNYFVFKLDDKEDGGGWFYIVQFNPDNSIQVSKVKDIFNDKSFCHIGLSQQNLFLANDHEIKIISFKNANKSQEVNEIVPKPGQFSNLMLEPNNRLHGFFENYDSYHNNFLLLTIENSQNVMTFAKLTFAASEETASNIQMHQYREVVTIAKNQSSEPDPIESFKFYINGKAEKEMCVGVARKFSGKVDFFYNYEHIDTSTESYDRVELTTRYIYLQQKSAQATNNNFNDEDNNDFEIPVVEIDQSAAQRIGESVGETIQLDPTKWDHINFDKIRNHARIFSAITLININFFIAFNKVVAVNDVVTKEWKFYSFTNTVSGLLRNQSSTNAHDMNVGVLLENGDINLIDRENELEDWKIAEKGLKIQGKILKVVSDWRDISSHYILAKQSSGKRSLYGFQKNVITELDKNVDMKDDEELLRCITPNEKEDFLLMSKKSLTIRTFTNTARGKGDQMNVEMYRKIKIVEITNPDPETKTNLQKLGLYDFHTAVGSQNHDYILLFNKFDVIKCKIQKKEQTNKDKKDGVSHKIFEIEEKVDYNIQNLQVIDGDYCYSLSNDSSNQGRPGFYIQNISSFINAGTNQTGNFRLKAATVGQNDLLDYYKDDQRLAYISSYDCIRIVPLLHRTTLGFIGMRPRKEYLGFRKYQDKIMALDKRGNITTWSVLTGKVDPKSKMTQSMLQQKNQMENFKNYEIYRNGPSDITYRSEWYQKHILLIDKKNPVANVDQVKFFSGRINSELGADTSYVSTLDKKFYRFRVIEILENQEVEEQFSFIHPYYGDDKFQRIFFSEDLDLMLERHDQNVFLYRRSAKAPETALGFSSKEISWILEKRIMRFPMDLASVTFVNYLFSPNLLFYLDFNKKENVFVIKNTLAQSDYRIIPKGLMNPGNGKDIALVGKKFQWLTNSLIRVINNDGIEKTVDISEKSCDQVSYCSVPMLDINSMRKEGSSHFFYDISITKENQTIERLKRKYQQYFTAISSGQDSDQELYNILFNVDFNIDNCKGKLVSDTSFTYFHLKIAEMMELMPKFNLKRYHPEEVKILALNIFPHGKTALHYAFQNLNIVRRFYKVIESEVQKAKELAASNDLEVTNQGYFEIPFLKTFSGKPDEIGKSPLHLCMKSGNFKSADIILQKLCNDSIDSHARSINDIIPALVEAELPSLGKYLDSRFGQTSLLQEHSFRRGCIIKFEDLEHGITTSELWPDKNELKRKLFHEKAKDGEPEKPEAECKVEFLDIVGLHCYTEEIGNEFFDALSQTSDLNLFSYRSVQSIIDFRWPLAREYTMKVLFFPFCIYLAVFVAWSNVFNQFIYEIDKEKSYAFWVADKVLAALLYFFSVYFLTNELRQMYHAGLGYFGQIWNYCDFLPSSLIIAIVSIKLRAQYFPDNKDDSINQSVLVSFHSLASFLMWLKLLYFMRIYKETGYLVKIISECIYGMRVFLFIYMVVLISFNEAFTRIDEALPEDPKGEIKKFQGKNWAQGYAFTFALAAGDTRADGYDDSVAPVIVWIIFCLVLLVMNVVMLNLLVAIVSKSFDEINDNWLSAMYQERASIIAENGYLIPWYRKVEHCKDKDEYLVVTRDLLSEENDTGVVEAVQNKINDIETSLNDFKKEYRETQEEFADKVSNTLADLLSAVKK